MYDFDRQSKPSLCSFTPQSLCSYIPQSYTLRTVHAKPHHYNNESQVTQLIETICRELFYYSSSMQKANSKQEQLNVQNILLENIKKILVFNLDKHGLIMQQKLLYLVVSFLHSKHNEVSNLREFLHQVHYILTSNLWPNPSQEIPFSLLLLLNGQFEQLLHYVKRQLSEVEDSSVLDNLVDMLVYKIQEGECKQNSNQGNICQSHIQKIVIQVDKSNWLKILISQIKKKDLNIKAQIQKQTLHLTAQRKTTQIYTLFQTKFEIQILLAVLCGDQQVIEELSRGSWGIYLNLHINFVETLPSSGKKQSYETILRGYMEKYFASKKSSKKSTQQHEEVFLIKLLNFFSPQNRFSFHQIYQSSFNVFSPVLSNLVGLLLIEYKMIDAYSICSNRDYHEDVILSLIDNCNKIGWTALVYVIGFVQNSPLLRDYQGKQAMWQNLMFQYLPYEIEQAHSQSSIQSQIKEIQEKLQDLNLVGLSSFTKTYLNTLLQLQLRQSNTRLTQTILQVFFLCLQMSDSSNANYCFHQMKTFISHYYKTRHFNYELMTSLENIFERKQSILSDKMEQKVEKLFCLIYKIQRIYQLANTGGDNGQIGSRQIVLRQVIEFNKMFLSSKKKKGISLSVELLRLSAYLHSRVENVLNIGAEHIPEMTQQNIQHEHTQSQLELNAVRQFEWNLHNYLSQWKPTNDFKTSQLKVSQQALDQLAYFDKYFY